MIDISVGGAAIEYREQLENNQSFDVDIDELGIYSANLVRRIDVNVIAIQFSINEALAVRFTLQILRQKAPGSSVEVRVPPWGAVQAIDGPAHTRGTPPAVVEMAPAVWLEIATGSATFERQLSEGLINASGERSNLSAWLPVVPLP